MQRFVKVKGEGLPDFSQIWLRVIDPNDESNELFSETMKGRMLNRVVGNSHYREDDPGLYTRLFMAAATELDYDELARMKNMTVLVQQIGSYFYFTDEMEITDECYSLDYPIDDIGDIVVCENSYNAEYDWLKYLARRYPNKTITVLNHFASLDKEFIKEIFSKTTYVTFSTTFTDFDWWDKLTECSTPFNIIMGYSHDYSKWEEACKRSQYKEIEVVEDWKK